MRTVFWLAVSATCFAGASVGALVKGWWITAIICAIPVFIQLKLIWGRTKEGGRNV